MGQPLVTGDRERFARAKEVFLQALDLPPEGRGAYLDSACAGDDGLREEVRSLLASEQEASGFCETPAASLLTMAAGPASPQLPAGTRLGAYEITGFLGAGGMGDIYAARHTVLQRMVAIKTIPPGLVDEAAKRRLLREARHAALLQHPGICVIHEVGEEAGTPFIVMQLVEGRPLSEILRSGPAPPDLVVRWGEAVASALEHAHRHRIVHRDLKASNVMIAAGNQPVILDFGLARRLPADGENPTSPTLSRDGALAGTVSYMAPEVLLGRPQDHRSDLWSLGVLLYQMATGRLPFPGQTPFEISSAIIGDPPRPMGRVPLAVRLVVERCLAKDPDRRYQRAAEVEAALQAIRRRRAWPVVGRLLVATRRRTIARWAIAGLGLTGAGFLLHTWQDRLPAPASRLSSIVVLPFENATGNAEAEYYAAGMATALVSQLRTVVGARVVPGTPGATAGADDPPGVARAYRADAAIAGRLREVSTRIVVDVWLVDPQGGRSLWSDSFERPVDQALVLHADVVRALTGSLRLALRADAGNRLAAIRAVNPEAYQEYLKGRYAWNLRTQASLETALGHFTRSIALDPTYAPAHAALADCYNQLGTVMVGTGSPREYRSLATAAAVRALQIDPASAEAHATLGYVRHYDWQWAEAEQAFRRSIQLDPDSPLPRIWYANLLKTQGRLPEALDQVSRARELDPYSPVINTNVGWVLTTAGRYDQAIAILRQVLSHDSTYTQAQIRLADVLARAGRLGEARLEAERLVRRTEGSPYALATLIKVLAMAGERREARALLDRVRTQAREGYVPPSVVATAFASLGETDSAIAWVERAAAERSNFIVYLPTDPMYPAIRNDPRIMAIVARAGLR